MSSSPPVASGPIPARLAELPERCERFGVRRLEAFGSAVEESFDSAKSDVDFLLELDPPAGLGYADAYFGFKEALEELFSRAVDLVSLAALRNPYLVAGIAPCRRLLYVA